MAIKVAYIFLKTFCQIKNIPFYASSGFALNNNSPIKALGKKYFVLQEDKSIDIRFLNENDTLEEFILPINIKNIEYSNETLPNYQLPAVN
jgi:tRNA A37 threonylcarbamoyladenosine modification protein TsaB